MSDPYEGYDERTKFQMEMTDKRLKETEQARKEWLDLPPLKRGITRHPLTSKSEHTSEIITMLIGLGILIAIVVLA